MLPTHLENLPYEALISNEVRSHYTDVAMFSHKSKVRNIRPAIERKKSCLPAPVLANQALSLTLVDPKGVLTDDQYSHLPTTFDYASLTVNLPYLMKAFIQYEFLFLPVCPYLQWHVALCCTSTLTAFAYTPSMTFV